MYLDPERKIAFFSNPRTASTATTWVLWHEYGLRRQGSRHHVQAMPGWKTVCTVRNPLDTLVSWYYLHRNFEGSFQEWLDTPECHNKWVKRGLFFALPYSECVLRYEHLQEDFDKLCDEVGWPRRTIPRKNQGLLRSGRPWQEVVAGCTIPPIRLM